MINLDAYLSFKFKNETFNNQQLMGEVISQLLLTVQLPEAEQIEFLDFINEHMSFSKLDKYISQTKELGFSDNDIISLCKRVFNIASKV